MWDWVKQKLSMGKYSICWLSSSVLRSEVLGFSLSYLESWGGEDHRILGIELRFVYKALP